MERLEWLKEEVIKEIEKDEVGNRPSAPRPNTSIDRFIETRIMSWIESKFVPAKEMKDNLKESFGQEMTTYSFNKYLFDYCKARNIECYHDKVKRFGDKLIKCYVFC